MDNETADFDLTASALYVAARAGAVNCADAFDLAALILRQYSPRSPEATRLASLSLDRQSGPHLAEAVLRLLEAVNFNSGFAEEPTLLTRIEDAMRVVNRDVTATELPLCHLYVAGPPLTSNAYVVTQDGHQGSGVGVLPASGCRQPVGSASGGRGRPGRDHAFDLGGLAGLPHP